MRKHLTYILLFFLACIFNACSEDAIDTYSDANYLQFTKYLKDSTLFSFLGLPNDDQAVFGLEVRLIGLPSDKDRVYKVEVMDEFTDAPTGTYILPTESILKAGKTVDTCFIVLKKTAELSQRSRRLTIRLVETKDFKLGQSDRIAAIINVTNVLSKPTWWSSTIDKTWLGEYSDKKYELFIQVNDGLVNLDTSDPHLVRNSTIKLKNYLKKMKDQGQTIYDENGQEVLVAYIGG